MSCEHGWMVGSSLVIRPPCPECLLARVRDLAREAGAAEERARIVAWLRAREEPELELVIELLERGAHSS
jgi:hypothetical protein